MDRLSQQQQLLEVLNRYTEACDTKDWRMLDDVFIPDAVATYRTRKYQSRSEIVALIRSRLSACGPTQHLMGNHTFRYENGRWTTRCKFRAWHQGAAPRQHVTYEVMGYYTDVWVEANGDWRLADRRLSVAGQTGDSSVLGPVVGGVPVTDEHAI